MALVIASPSVHHHQLIQYFSSLASSLSSSSYLSLLRLLFSYPSPSPPPHSSVLVSMPAYQYILDPQQFYYGLERVRQSIDLRLEPVNLLSHMKSEAQRHSQSLGCFYAAQD